MLLTDIARRCKVTVQAVSLLLKNMAYREQVHAFRIRIPWRGSLSDGMVHDPQEPEQDARKKQ
jgi:hypothetical protein